MVIPEAKELDLKAESTGDFINCKVFTVEGKMGLFRQVARDGRAGIKAGEGAHVAHVGRDKLIEVKPWTAMMEVLRDHAKIVPEREVWWGKKLELNDDAIPPFEVLPKADAEKAPKGGKRETTKR